MTHYNAMKILLGGEAERNKMIKPSNGDKYNISGDTVGSKFHMIE